MDRPLPRHHPPVNLSNVTRRRTFRVVFEEAEEGGFIARVPALPGCVTQGETLAEAEAMVKDAIKGYCVSLKKAKKRIPKAVRAHVESVSVSIPA